MEVIIQPDAAAANAVAARLFARVIRRKTGAVLGLATGSTPLALYREWRALKLDWRKVKTFNLDEYVGLAPAHPQSYHHFMWENLFRHVNIAKKNIHIPDGLAKDIPQCCANYEKQIRAAGGIDVQLLGIGTDGHIGFNEPTSSLASRTRIKTLTPQTRKDNARFFGSEAAVPHHVITMGIGTDGHIGFNEPTSSLASRTRIKTLTPQTRKDNARFFGSEAAVPHHVITMGIGTILDARHCVLLAFGRNKARAVAAAVEGPVTAMNPASALQQHPQVTVLLDEAAASRLKLREYYRWVYENKPDWQKI
jgi:glucosamine-6-phosphate deaminase